MLLLLLLACSDDPGLNPIPGNVGPGDTDTDTEIVITDPHAPVAVCSVDRNPVQPPFETATFDGSQSYDPDGGELVEYDWRLVSAPAGNTEGLESPSAVSTRFTPLLAGNYFVDLTVVNEAGLRSEPCSITLQAVPGQDLWIELFWSSVDEDMDLHLLKPGGSPRTSGDCYFANCTVWGPDWGVIGDPSDDPILDLDDIPGTGPENINIENPVDGTYTVFVHDYEWTGYHPEPTDVTVNIYFGGLQVYTTTRTVVGEDTDTYIAMIDTANGVVTPL